MARNVLLFTSTFPRSGDDPLTPRFVYHLGRELSKTHQVFVLAPHAPGAALEEDLDGMRVVRFRYFYPEACQQLAYGTGMTNNLRAHPTAWLQVPSFFYCQRTALAKTVRRFDIEIVNSHWMVPQGLTSAWAVRSLGVHHVLTVHSAGLFLLRRIPAGRFLARRILNNTDALYIVSRNNHRMLEDLVGKTVKAQVLPMGIHTGFYGENRETNVLKKALGLPEKGPLILFVGKLSRIKGVDFLLQGFPEVLAKFPSARLVVVGSGPEEASLKKLAQNLGLEGRVLFAGQKNQQEVRDFLQACDLVVIPSIQDSNGQVEGFPVVLLEALACGKPVVGTNAGGTPEGIVEGETGYIVPPQNPTALARGILTVLDRGPSTFFDRAIESVKQFDWQTIGQHYSQTFDRL